MKLEGINLAALRGTPEIKDKKQAELARACKELEGVFLRRLLEAAKFGEHAGGQGYGSMIVDALATSISEGGGLGLSDRIRDALAPTQHHSAAKTAEPSSAPKVP